MAAIGISGSGEVSIKNVGAGFALKQSWNNMKHEAIEEGSQTITQKTFTAVGTNSIKRHIDNVYDTDTWEGFVGEWATTLQDIVVNAGAGLFDPETYEAAIQGAIGSAMGFFTLKQTGKGVKGLRPSWQGSIFNIRSTVEAENKARTELKEALQNYIGPIDTEDKARQQLQQGVENAISKNSGIRILESMTATKKALDTYNESVEKRPEDTHANKELAVDALVHSVSTLHQIRNTTFGQNMMRNLMYQANMLEEDVETSEMSEDEINKKRLEKAKEFLTTQPESEELQKKKNAALTEVQTWLKGQGKQVRTVEEIAENPTEAEAQALVDIVNTAKQTIEMVDKIADIDASNSRNVQGLNFVAKNELNAKSLLLYNQEQRLKHANDRLTRIGEQQSPTSNTTLSAEQKQSVAIMGNSDEKRAESRKTYEKELEETKETIKKIKESLKETKKQWAKAKTSGDELSQTQYAFTVAVLNDRLENLKQSAKITKDFLTRDKKTFWDILKNKKGTEDIIESGRVLTAYDIITLTPYERAMMLDAENKDKYSEEQQKQIDEARSLLSQNQTLDLINGTSSLHANIIANKEYINDVLTNIDAYNEHVNSAEKTFRTNVLNYRYQQGITNEVTQDEAKSFMDKLNADVKNGLISEQEKQQLIQKAIENEKIRNKDKAQDNTNLKRGWEIYQEIQNQAYEIGNTFVNAKVTVDEAAFDELMKFLSEQNYTLKQFNDLSQQEKQSLLNNSELLNERNNNNIDAQKYVDFAAEILHLYEEAKLKGQQINKDIARGNNNKETAEERIVPKEEQEEPGYLVQQDESNAELINKRSSIDGSPRFASIISSILGYIKNTNVLQDNKWGPLSKQVYDAVKKVSMTKEAITSKEDLWSKIEEEISLYDNSANVRNAWLGIKSQIDKVDVQQTSAAARTSPTVRDRSLGNNSANSSTMHTEKVSFLRNDKTKRPILEFLGKHSYAEATKYAAQLSQGSTGQGGQIYYVTDSYTTQQYRESLGDSYTDDNNLPVFTCIAVSEDFEGAFPVKYGNNTIYLVPIGVLKENTDNNNNASGINYTKSIRQLAVNQQSNSVEPTLVMANDAPLTSIPQNYKNYLMPENQNDFTGRRSITEEIKGFGDQIKSAVNSIIKKLKVGKIGDKDWNQIYYDNGSPDKTIPIAKQAGLNELVDASENSTVAEILANTLDREIDNPIIRMFYKNVLGVKNSISELIQSKDHLLNLAQQNDKKAINELNEQINKRLSLSFYPANYKGVRYWEYRINVDGLLKQNPEFILEAVPIINKETDTPNQAKAITLLDFTNLFDENDEIDLKIPHANTILQQLLFEFDDEGKMHLRRRGNDEFGNVFAQVQASTTVVNHANGIFTEDENKTYTEEQKKQIQENNHSVLSAIIEGGGLIIEGPIDNEIDYTVINKPEALNKQGELVQGASRTSLQAGVETRLNSMMGGSQLDTVEDKDKRQVVGRSDYIGIKRAKNKKNNTNEIKRHNMWVTTLAKWVSGGFKKVWGESKINKDITLTVGDNADLVFRHVLWTSEFNRSSERDTIKKIPLDYSQSGEGYYTDQELEQQFGFKASQVKALAYAFTSSLNQLREERKFTFYTNVVKPQATIEVTDGSKTYTVPVAGELDMLAIGEDGRVHPIDFKTVRVSNREHLDTLRQGTVEQRTKVLKEIWQHDDFNSFEGYSRQINLYQAALSKNFSVGEGFILAVPVYYEDAKVKTKVNDNSEYGNKTLMKLDANDNEVEPYLEGLSLFEATDRTAPVKLTYIPVEFNGNFKIDMQDILAMAEGDQNFLRTNPQFADAVDAIMEANKAKEDKEGTPNKVKIDLTIPKSKQSNGGVRMEGNTAVWDDPDDEVVTENTKQTAQNTNANFAEIDRQIAQLKSLSNFNENTNTVELIVGDTSYEFTVKQLEDIKKEIKEQSEKEGLNAEEQYNKLTVNDLCTALNCRI